MRDPRWMLLLAALPACDAGGRGAGPAAGVAAVAEGLAPGFSIGAVQIDPGTYPFLDAAHLLTTAEGAGPRTLEVSVLASVAPQVSFTGTHTPSHSDLTKALGYSVTDTVELSADSSVLVPIDAYARVDAYPTFQKTTFAIFGLGTYPIGTGVSYRPIGVYFDTCGCIGPDPCGASCSPDFSAPGAGGARAGGAGAGGAGAGGAGTGGAGTGGAATTAPPDAADAGGGDGGDGG